MISGDLAEQAQELRASAQPFVTATVVRVVHPTSVRPGDNALVTADGTIHGFVGGICVQASVRLHAACALETGDPILLRVSPDTGDCEDVEEGVVAAHNPCLSGGALDIFLEPHLPARRLLIGGDTPIAHALVGIARAAGYEVVREAARLLEPAATDTAVVIASHGEDEEIALARALKAGVGYIGLVASERRGAAICSSLDVPDALRERVHTPAGLPIDARTPPEVAIAILAEVVAEQGGPAAPFVARVPAPATTETAVDPICGMEVVAADTTIHAGDGGSRVYFCCEGCRDRYLEHHGAATS